MRNKTVTVDCPCCMRARVEVMLYWEDTEGLRPGWEMDDYDADCDCYDYMERVPKLRVKGVLFAGAASKYREDIMERAMEQA